MVLKWSLLLFDSFPLVASHSTICEDEITINYNISARGVRSYYERLMYSFFK